MKKSFYILAAVLMMVSGSCTKEEKSPVAGQWNITDLKLTTKAVEIGKQKVDVYIDFKNDGTYELFQMLGQGRFQYYKGGYRLAGDLLTGNYHEPNKIRDWGNSYRVEINGEQLVMTATVGSSDVYTYTRCTIPEEVRAQAVR